MTPEQISGLRRIAEAADEGRGRPWVRRSDSAPYPQSIVREGDVVLVAETFEGPEYPPAFAEHIIAFDPPTVLALLDEVERLRDVAYPFRWTCQGCGTEHRERWTPTGMSLVCPACTATTYFREA